jgi:hypothetical protein
VGVDCVNLTQDIAAVGARRNIVNTVKRLGCYMKCVEFLSSTYC